MKNVLAGCVLCASVAVLQTVSRPVLADDAAVDATAAKQRALYEQGNKLYDEKKWKEAEEAFRAAFAVRKGYDVAGNLGDVELMNGEPRAAAEHLSYALREFPAGGRAALRERLSKRLKEARALVGALRVQVSKDGAEVFVDGRSIGRSPLADEVFVDPGSRTVEAKFEGYAIAREAFTIEKGATREVRLSLAALVVVAPPPPPVHKEEPIVKEPRRSLVPVFVIGGVGAASLVGGLVLIGLAESKKSDAKALSVETHHSCVVMDPAPQGKCKDLTDAASRADTFGNVGIGGLVVAGIAAAGVATYLLWPAPRRTPARSVRVAPVVSLSGGGLSVIGAF